MTIFMQFDIFKVQLRPCENYDDEFCHSHGKHGNPVNPDNSNPSEDVVSKPLEVGILICMCIFKSFISLL